MDDFFLAALFALAPTVLAGGFFWLIMRAIVNADRAERSAYAAIEVSERARVNTSARSANPRGTPRSSVRP